MKTLTFPDKAKRLFSDYCHFLACSFANFTQTYFADHTEKWSHDAVNRFLGSSRIPSRELWASVKDDIVYDENGYVLFDDVVVSKPFGKEIELVRRQWSGSEKQVVDGIGIVTCVYVNPETQAYWIIDYRIFDKARDGKTKIDHLLDMLHNAHFKKCLPFRTVLFDSWYTSMKVMKAVEFLRKVYYAPLKRNRLLDDTGGVAPAKRVDALSWTETEKQCGKIVHLRKFPKGHVVKLFRIVSGSRRTEYIVTNDLSQSDTDATQRECRVRWKIEQLHRELKQVTGIGKCQCRKLRAQRNHIACCFQVWVYLKRAARKAEKTIYEFKLGFLEDYMRQQLSNPTIISETA